MLQPKWSMDQKSLLYDINSWLKKASSFRKKIVMCNLFTLDLRWLTEMEDC